MCVLFEFRQFLNSENSSTYFKVSCLSLQKNMTDEMSLSDCITYKLEAEVGISTESFLVF